ncbi:MAG: peptidyl-prolyl cis-trans isomerase [Candidatus Cloacimonetes bacterium]|nr:peptidyl-prolyl cis-trans isomerase [Candidatus Cloacimonadota bacterium]
MFDISIIKKRPESIIIILIVLCFSSIIDAQTRVIPPETILAEYDNGIFTKADFDEEFNKLPNIFRARYSSREGKIEFLEATVLNKILYLKAQQLGIDRDPEAFTAYRDLLNPYYAGIFRRIEIKDNIDINEDEIYSFYRNNLERFTELGNATIEYLMIDDISQSVDVLDALQSRRDFNEIVSRYSTHQRSIRNDGIISNIMGNGFIPGLGRDEELDSEIFNAPMNEWIGPLETETGIHFFKVLERNSRELKPFEEVREEINNRLLRVKEIDAKTQKVAELKNRYNVNVNYNLLFSLNMFNLTPFSEELKLGVVTADIPEMNVTVGDLYEHFRNITPFIMSNDLTSNLEYYNLHRHLPREEWQELSSPESLERLINNVIDVNLFAYEAREMGYDDLIIGDPERETIRTEQPGTRYDYVVFQNPEVQQLRRHIILQNLFQQKVIDVANPTQEDLREYYEENLDDFSVKESRRLNIFFFDTESEANASRNTVLQAVEEDDEWPIIHLINASKYPQEIRSLQFVERDNNLPIFGQDTTLYNTIWNTKLGVLSEIEQTSNGLYFFLIVLEHNPLYVYPLDRVQRDVSEILVHERRTERWEEYVQEIISDYNVQFYRDRLFITLTADELFSLAEQSQLRGRFTEALDFLDQVIENYQNNDDDYRALFSKAFILARELGRSEEAAQIFRQLIEEYPYGNLHDSAEFMLDSLIEG